MLAAFTRLPTLLAAVTLAVAAPSASTEQACEELAIAVPERVSTQFTFDYVSEVNSYWSTALRSAKPACLVLPQSAQEVAAAVRVLNKYDDVQFAVKSGGHTPNERHSSILDGVLISTKDLSGVTYNSETGLAYVRPGGEWNDVIGPLDEQGVAVVGGRLGMQASSPYRAWTDFRRPRWRWRLPPPGWHILPFSATWPGCRRKSSLQQWRTV